MEPLVKVQCLKHVYPDKTEVSICGLDFVVNPGERVVILGPNGAGKTTLLSHILGLLSPVEGVVEVMGLKPDKDFKKLRRNIGVVFQNVDEQIIGPRVYDDIAFTPLNDGMDKKKVEKIVKQISSVIGIEDILYKIPHYLSGGQKKKVALGGAIITKPKLLILDEPFDGLDPKSKAEMIDLINKINKNDGTTLIITTHDINLVPEIADIIYVLYDGRIVARGKPDEVFSKKVDILKQANLELPILMELFLRLGKSGFNIELPHNLDEAEKQILSLLKKENV